MTAIIQMILDIISGRAKTRIYVTFVVWLLIMHCDVIFITLFQDQALIYQKTNLLKGEYILNYLSSSGTSVLIVVEVARILLATAITYLMIWVIPSLINEKSYRKELDAEYSLRKMKIKKDEELNRKEDAVADKKLSTLQKEEKVLTHRKRIESSPEMVTWDEEFRVFSKLRRYAEFSKIIDCVYSYQGDPNRMVSGPNSELVGYLDAISAVNVKAGKIEFTQKGKYFMSRYLENRH